MDIQSNRLEVPVNSVEQLTTLYVGEPHKMTITDRESNSDLLFSVSTLAVEAAQEPERIVEAIPYTKESVAQQLAIAHIGHHAIVDILNTNRQDIHRLPNVTEVTLAKQFEAWFTSDKLAYVTAAQEADLELCFTLVATPNVIVSWQDIAKVAKKFGEDQPYPTYIDGELLSKYKDNLISGTEPDSGNPVVFSLVPNKLTPVMSGTVRQQRVVLLPALQAKFPSVKVTSPFEDATYLATLRAAGHTLVGKGTLELTYNRKFNLPAKHLGKWSRLVLRSYVGNDGQPGVGRSASEYDDDARVVVG